MSHRLHHSNSGNVSKREFVCVHKIRYTWSIKGLGVSGIGLYVGDGESGPLTPGRQKFYKLQFIKLYAKLTYVKMFTLNLSKLFLSLILSSDIGECSRERRIF